jgi:hypothetical protein
VKTVYTDKLGVYPWAMLFVSAAGFWTAFEGFAAGDGSRLGLGVGSGGVFLTLALKRFWDIRTAKREGRDPTILTVKENDR